MDCIDLETADLVIIGLQPVLVKVPSKERLSPIEYSQIITLLPNQIFLRAVRISVFDHDTIYSQGMETEDVGAGKTSVSRWQSHSCLGTTIQPHSFHQATGSLALSLRPRYEEAFLPGWSRLTVSSMEGNLTSSSSHLLFFIFSKP